MRGHKLTSLVLGGEVASDILLLEGNDKRSVPFPEVKRSRCASEGEKEKSSQFTKYHTGVQHVLVANNCKYVLRIYRDILMTKKERVIWLSANRNFSEIIAMSFARYRNTIVGHRIPRGYRDFTRSERYKNNYVLNIAVNRFGGSNCGLDVTIALADRYVKIRSKCLALKATVSRHSIKVINGKNRERLNARWLH